MFNIILSFYLQVEGHTRQYLSGKIFLCSLAYNGTQIHLQDQYISHHSCKERMHIHLYWSHSNHLRKNQESRIVNVKRFIGTCESIFALTEVFIVSIKTFASILTLDSFTFICWIFTIRTFISLDTFTFVLIYSIHTFSIMKTHNSITVINVYFTVFTWKKEKLYNNSKCLSYLPVKPGLQSHLYPNSNVWHLPPFLQGSTDLSHSLTLFSQRFPL